MKRKNDRCTLWMNIAKKSIHCKASAYLIVGIMTTLINFFVYYLSVQAGQIGYQLANGFAFVVSIIFAYFGNKVWVFHSTELTKMATAFNFFYFLVSRLSTLLFEMALLYIFIECIHGNVLSSKIICNIVVVMINYVISKKYIFKKSPDL